MADKLREGGLVGNTELRPDQTAPQKSAARTPRPQAHRAQQKAITQGLRKFFDTVASEPVPDDFMAILRQIDDGKKGDA